MFGFGKKKQKTKAPVNPGPYGDLKHIEDFHADYQQDYDQPATLIRDTYEGNRRADAGHYGIILHGFSILVTDLPAFDRLDITDHGFVSTGGYGPRQEGDYLIYEDGLHASCESKEAVEEFRTKVLALANLRSQQKQDAEQKAADATLAELDSFMAKQ